MSLLPNIVPAVVQELIYGLKIKDVMSTTLTTATKKEKLRDIQQTMKRMKITGVPIVEEGRLFGIISVEDILNAWSNGFVEDPAEAHMTKNVIVLEDDMPLALGISYFDKYAFGRFPVLNKDNKLVGIITSRDILNKLLIELNKTVERLESKVSEKSSLPDVVNKEYFCQRFNFELAGTASGDIKKMLQLKGIPQETIRRVSVAAYELEMNLIIHSASGVLKFHADKDKVEIVAFDEGPGIADVNLAMSEGYSTANDWIRSLGFGAGMGLPNVKRVSDDFQIESELGKGTKVKAQIKLGVNL